MTLIANINTVYTTSSGSAKLRAVAGWTGEENCGVVTFQGQTVTNNNEPVTNNQ